MHEVKNERMNLGVTGTNS